MKGRGGRVDISVWGPSSLEGWNCHELGLGRVPKEDAEDG